MLREGVSGIANLFDFIVNPTRFRGLELEAGSGLYTIEDGLVEQPRAAGIDGSCNVIHDLKRRSTCPKKLSILKLTGTKEKTCEVKVNISTCAFTDSG